MVLEEYKRGRRLPPLPLCIMFVLFMQFLLQVLLHTRVSMSHHHRNACEGSIFGLFFAQNIDMCRMVGGDFNRRLPATQYWELFEIHLNKLKDDEQFDNMLDRALVENLLGVQPLKQLPNTCAVHVAPGACGDPQEKTAVKIDYLCHDESKTVFLANECPKLDQYYFITRPHRDVWFLQDGFGNDESILRQWLVLALSGEQHSVCATPTAFFRTAASGFSLSGQQLKKEVSTRESIKSSPHNDLPRAKRMDKASTVDESPRSDPGTQDTERDLVSSMQSLTQTQTNGKDLTHFYVDHQNGGWGNRLYQVLFAVVTHNPDFPKPCFGGSIGKVVGLIFKAIEVCPDSTNGYDYVYLGGMDSRAWPSVQETIKRGSQAMHPYQALDRATVVNLLGEDRLAELSRTCAVHIRFGDAFMRDTWGKDDIRVPGCEPGLKTKESKEFCFAHVADWVDTRCRDENEIIYVVTDVPAFAGYFETNRLHRQVRYNQDPAGPGLHLNDMERFSLDEPKARQLLQDWLVLALSNSSHEYNYSTFYQTANLGFYLEPKTGNDGKSGNLDKASDSWWESY